MKKISAVIACYKDAEAIPEMHERLTKVLTTTKYDYEIGFCTIIVLLLRNMHRSLK